MSVEYTCDRCEKRMEPEQVQGYELEIAGFRIALKPQGHLCPFCIIALLQRAAEASTIAHITSEIVAA